MQKKWLLQQAFPFPICFPEFSLSSSTLSPLYRPLYLLQHYQCCTTIHHSIFDVPIWQLKLLTFTLNQLFEVLDDTQSEKRCLTGKNYFSIEQTKLSLVYQYNITFLYAMTATYLSNINLEINKLETLYSASQIKLDSAF